MENQQIPPIETIEQARERFPKALSRVFDIEKIKDSQQIRPGQSKDHVFNFVDMRLIVSIDKFKNHNHLHVSASFPEQTWLKLKEEYSIGSGADEIVQKLSQVVRDRYSEISGESGEELEPVLLTGRGVLHLHKPLFAHIYSLN